MKVKSRIELLERIVIMGIIGLGLILFSPPDASAQPSCSDPDLQVCIPDDPDYPPGSWLCCSDCANVYRFTGGPAWTCRECNDPDYHLCPNPYDPDNPDKWVCCWGDDCAYLYCEFSNDSLQCSCQAPECEPGQILCPHPETEQEVCCWGDDCAFLDHNPEAGGWICPSLTPTPTPTPPPCIPDPITLQLHAPEAIEAGSQGQIAVSGLPDGAQVTWSPVRKFPEAGETIIIDDFDESTGMLSVNAHSGSGTIRLTATYTGVECCPDVECTISDTVDIEVNGCSSCAAGVCWLGEGEPGMHSIALELTLGKTASGKSAGRLFLKATQMTPELATPAMLFYDRASDEVEVMESSPGVLRQVRAPQGQCC